MCRFYRAPAFGDSHFYSAAPAECAQTAAAHPVDWIYESPNVFYVQLPNTTTGVCPAGTVAVYRFFNTVTTNHRYTTEQVIRDQMSGFVPLDGRRLRARARTIPIMCAVARSAHGAARSGSRPRPARRRERVRLARDDDRVHAERDAAEAFVHPVLAERAQRLDADRARSPGRWS